MAFRRGGGYRRSFASRRPATRSRTGYRTAAARSYRGARRRGATRRVSNRAPQTVKIVVEQIPANAVTRPGLFTQVAQAPRRSRSRF